MQDHDQAFGDTLLKMARRDAQRAVANPADRLARSVALWMTDQLGAYAASLPATGAAPLRTEAHRLRNQVIKGTAPARRHA
ncbi:MAG: hypothetical protein KDA20_09955 [Phycisphaerales bacterium]|nr:hypothetical protein [Phycisphaerales bacterium]